MKLKVTSCASKIYQTGIAVSVLILLTGCQELNRAVDGLLGREAPAFSVAYQTSRVPLVGFKSDILEATLRVRTPASNPEREKEAAARVTKSDAESPEKDLNTVSAVNDRNWLQVAVDPTLPGDLAPVQTAQATTPAPQTTGSKVQPTEKPRPPAVQPAPPARQKPAQEAQKPSAQPLVTQKGKKQAPGQLSPTAPAAAEKEEVKRTPFAVERDPFRPPTEILPTECPPSMPLCRFDRSQLKLVGVIQVNEGQFKGMVEDPDGRGYFVMTGTQIAGATVTQVSNKGITMHLHKTGQDVVIPLYREPREGEEF